jgi:basic amino acid/polyamine antiporter, APA family
MPEQVTSHASLPQLKRKLSLWEVMLIGFGSIIGTGVFVSLGIAAGVAGSAVILALIIAAVVAICTGLSSAQLAVNQSVNAGTYEYGYRYLSPWLGFMAGWTFLMTKSTLAATAALGSAGYLLSAIAPTRQALLIPVALVVVLLIALIKLNGFRRPGLLNTAMVAIVLLSLLCFIGMGLPQVALWETRNLLPIFDISQLNNWKLLLHATALLFGAYTGYGQIAALGTQIQQPRLTLSKAMLLTIGSTLLLYVGVAVVGAGTVSAPLLGSATEAQVAPLEFAAQSFMTRGTAQILAVGAVVAMLGILSDLIGGLASVLMAMGRRNDAPAGMTRLTRSGTIPYVAVGTVAAAIAILVLIGNVRTIWTFSAFTGLIYYAITNLAALKQPAQERLYPRWTAYLGLVACLFLAFWVEWDIWLLGLVLMAIGLIWHGIMRWSREESNHS